MKIPCELLDITIETEGPAKRIISLSSGFTEALYAIGREDTLIAVSEYCPRYCPCEHLPRAGWYLNADFALLHELKPDLVLMTSGIQLRFAKLLARQGLPVYVLPLPSSIHGVLENILHISAAVGSLISGRKLAVELQTELLKLRASWKGKNPSIYAETWFGVHGRRIGGLSYIHDILWYAGGEPVFADKLWGYAHLDLDAATEKRPDIFLGFHEPEHKVDFQAESLRRGWKEQFNPAIIHSTVDKGKNIIHDGPSLLETARWLQKEMLAQES
ncbi:helical backbone metal receptor [Spirochaeta dissipatitropha]